MKTQITAIALCLAASSAFAAGGEAESAIAAAIAAVDRAASVGGEWRDTRAIIKEAQAAAKAGHEAEALKLAQRALEQGELGYTQAVGQR